MRRYVDLIVRGFIILAGSYVIWWVYAKGEVWLCVNRKLNSQYPNPDREEVWDSCEQTHAEHPRSFFPPPK